jgi:glycosyltransferase involved in cell wall biosynthesis
MSLQGDTTQRRILWIAYVFPPVGGSQGLRMQQYLGKICRAYPDFIVDVLTIHQTKLNAQLDPHLLADIPAAVRIYRVKPGALHRLRYRWGFDRRYLASFDSRFRHIMISMVQLSNLGWIPHAALWLGRKAARRYDAVYVFVDPFSSLVLALLASILNPDARLVLEYGDARISPRGVTRIFGRPAARIEERVLRSCSAAIVRTTAVADAYLARYRSVPADRLAVIYGGVDCELYDAAEPSSGTELFQVCYTGTMYSHSADPSPFLHAVARIVATHQRLVHVVIAGAESPGVTRLIKELELAAAVTMTGHLPIDRIVPIQRSASLLLAFGVENPYQISSKLAQYITARVPVLYIRASLDDAGAELIRSSGRGLVVENTADAIEAAIVRCLHLWQHDGMSSSFNLSRTDEFSWQRVAGEVAARITGQPGTL